MSGRPMRKNILLTGEPGYGKSTLIERIVLRLDRPTTGFFTREMRESGRRVGFSITTLDGKRGLLAHVDIPGRYRVGRYGVNLPDLDQIAVPSMLPQAETVVVVIDEVGKMECLSPVFRQTLMRTLDSPNTVIGSISRKGNAFIEAVKKRTDVHLVTVTETNRDTLLEDVLRVLPQGFPAASMV